MRDFEIAQDEIQVRVERQAQQALSTGLLASQQGVTIVQEVPATSGSVSAHYITTQSEAALSNEFSLGSLGSGLLKQSVSSAVSTPAIATATDVSTPVFGADAGATDTYVVTLAPALASYVVGTHLRFFANTANTGAASVNFSGLGALTIVKVAGGITTALADNDIRAGQWVDGVIAAGSNFQMQSTSGNAAAGGTVTSFSATPAGIFDVATATTTPALSLDNQAANVVLAGPSTGAAATPAFRALVNADLPASISARVYNSGAQSIANTTVVAITFDSERWDSDTMHSTSVNTSRLTATTAGLYDIGGCLLYAASVAGNVRSVQIRLNGATTLAVLQFVPSGGGTLPGGTVSTQYSLAAADYVELIAYQDSGGALNTSVLANASPEFWMTRIGPRP